MEDCKIERVREEIQELLLLTASAEATQNGVNKIRNTHKVRFYLMC